MFSRASVRRWLQVNQSVCLPQQKVVGRKREGGVQTDVGVPTYQNK